MIMKSGSISRINGSSPYCERSPSPVSPIMMNLNIEQWVGMQQRKETVTSLGYFDGRVMHTEIQVHPAKQKKVDPVGFDKKLLKNPGGCRGSIFKYIPEEEKVVKVKKKAKKRKKVKA